MNREQIWNRIEVLRDCIAWSIQNNRLLTDSQRICLNQERAAWLRVLEDDALNPGHVREPRYKVPVILESKIQQITTLAQSSQWDREHYEKQYQNN
jgi:hypothetical protein|tara:strand:+ start:5414 stop:5701 length:288 start_codon:yes stop_codon:yes gene_type:complete